MSKLRSVPVVLVGVLLLAGSLSADPFQREQVPAKAKWLVHADVKAFLASKTGTFVLEQLRAKGLGVVLDNIREVFALDVTKDLASVTVYGTRFGEKPAIILLRAAMDRDRLLQVFQSNETYRELKYAGHSIHQWTDNPHADPPGATKYGAFHGDDLAVMTEDVRLAQLALDVLDKRVATLPARRGAPSPAKDTFLTAFLAEVPPVGKDNPGAALLAKIASARVEAGESKGRLRVRVALTAKTAETASNLRKVAEGVLALIDLASPEGEGASPAAPADRVIFEGAAIPAELAAVLEHVTVSAQGRTVQVNGDVPVASATALLKRIINPEKAEAAATDPVKE
jgi:hypothetical protein